MALELNEQDIKKLKILCTQMRVDVLKMIHKAQSGHPGGSLSAVEILAVLFSKSMMHNCDWDKNCNFNFRDRFILSKGHASATLYSAMARCGYFDADELLTFRKLGSRLQGHPSCSHLPGVEVSTGSLGQGLSMACGVAMGLKLDKNPATVFAYVGDGELQEGSIWESAMSAAHFKLDNLIVFVDRNKLQIDGCTEKIKSLGQVETKFKAFGWNTIEIDGHDPVQIYDAVEKAKTSRGTGIPSVIIANTIKGKGISFMENNANWHGKAPNDSELEKALSELGGLC